MSDLAVENTTEADLAGALAAVREKLSEAEKKIAHLESALASNRRISMAIGILMATRKITEEQAFDLLSRASQSSNRKVRDVADEVVLTGALNLG